MLSLAYWKCGFTTYWKCGFTIMSIHNLKMNFLHLSLFFFVAVNPRRSPDWIFPYLYLCVKPLRYYAEKTRLKEQSQGEATPGAEGGGADGGGGRGGGHSAPPLLPNLVQNRPLLTREKENASSPSRSRRQDLREATIAAASLSFLFSSSQTEPRHPLRFEPPQTGVAAASSPEKHRREFESTCGVAGDTVAVRE